MKKTSRDNFPPAIKKRIGLRAGWLCSYPSCRKLTAGAGSDKDSYINIGVASHISAASPGGPRFNKDMTPEMRKSVQNGIWMCRDHSTIIDSDDPQYTLEKLHAWKEEAEQISLNWVSKDEPPFRLTKLTRSALSIALFQAATSDLEIFRRTVKWPSTNVNLMVRILGVQESISTSALATLASEMDDLVLIAGPGMGKTTALFQIAEGLLSNLTTAPIVVSLGNWATETVSIIESILKRPAFRNFSEHDFREIAATGGVMLLLDGWNELNADSRLRAKVQLDTLKAELPELHLVLTTRQQLLDVPIDGEKIELLPLNEEQQNQIAVCLKGDSGANIVDRAWRTPGLNELIEIPLYLIALLKLPDDAAFPTTKEELLRHFVGTHQSDIVKAEILNTNLQGFQNHYLTNLAVLAMKASNTAITDIDARKSINETSAQLVEDSLIIDPPRALVALETLIANHVLVRRSDTDSYMFQHHQFQEWYASHFAEKLIMGIDDPVSLNSLRVDILDQTFWEEVVLFSVERLSRGTAIQIEKCAIAILATLDVDPMLAAEMIFRSSEDVWRLVSEDVTNFANNWHKSTQKDRALRFMFISARPEFLNFVWPLLTDSNRQIRISSRQSYHQFRPAILGGNAIELIASLSTDLRDELLPDMAYSSDVVGLDLIVKIAKNEPNLTVRAKIVNHLYYRSANRHIAEILKEAPEEFLDIVVRDSNLDEAKDSIINQRITAAKERYLNRNLSDYDKLYQLLNLPFSDGNKAEVFELIKSVSIVNRGDDIYQVLFRHYSKYPEEITNGVLHRLQSEEPLFHKAYEFLALSNTVLQDKELIDYVLANPKLPNHKTDAAASLLDYKAVGILIDEYLKVWEQVDANKQWTDEERDRYHDFIRLIAHTPGASLIKAVTLRSNQASVEQLDHLSQLLRRDERNGAPRLFDEDSITLIQNLIQDWAIRMLSSKDATRRHKANLAVLASLAPSANLIPTLKSLLNDNLVRYEEFRQKAFEQNWRDSEIVHEAQWPHTDEYFRAFRFIKSSEVAPLMVSYLKNPHFGEYAARFLTEYWKEENEQSTDQFIYIGVDYRNIKDKYVARISNPHDSVVEADQIFEAIEYLLNGNNPTENEISLAIDLGRFALQLPNAERFSVKQQLLNLASPRVQAQLLLSMVLSGELLKSVIVHDGLVNFLEDAKLNRWLIEDSDSYRLREWLRLLPFIDNQSEVMNILNLLPEDRRPPHLLAEMIRAFPYSPSPSAENTFFELGEFDNRFYSNLDWMLTAFRFNTESAAIKVIDLIVNGKVNNRDDALHQLHELAKLLDMPVARKYVYELVKSRPYENAISKLANAIGENPDEEGLLMLVQLEMNFGKIQWAGIRSVERVITNRVPIDQSYGSFKITPASATSLRKKLLALTADGSESDIASKYLEYVDSVRDEYGTPSIEPRHPDIRSGKPWPILSIH